MVAGRRSCRKLWLQGILVLVWLLNGTHLQAADSGAPDLGGRLLERQLYDLESRTIQRGRREGKLSDLQIRQDKRLAKQRLNTIRTRRPNNPSFLILKRRLDRSRKLGRLFDIRKTLNR